MQENTIFFTGDITEFVMRLGQMVFYDCIKVIVREGETLTDQVIDLLSLWTDNSTGIFIIFED